MERAFLKVLIIEIEMEDKILGIGHFERIQKGWVVKTNFPTFKGQEGMLEAFQIATKTTGTVEGFKDGDTELWNVIEVYESEDEAIEAGKENNQLFIFNIESSTFKWVV